MVDTEINERTIKAANVTSTREKADRLDQLHQNKEKLLEYIRMNVKGVEDNTTLKTIYGEKPHVYLDYTASGKNLSFIEDYIENTVMPLYANTHSMQSASGK